MPRTSESQQPERVFEVSESAFPAGRVEQLFPRGVRFHLECELLRDLPFVYVPFLGFVRRICG
jgi:hypothetical protein